MEMDFLETETNPTISPTIKNEAEDIEAVVEMLEPVQTLESSSTSTANNLQENGVNAHEVDEEIDIMGTSDTEEIVHMPVTRSSSRNASQVSFAHPAAGPSAAAVKPTRVVIPASAIKKRIVKKPAKTKYVKDPNKKDMTFNTQDYNYAEDETFFKKEEIPLPFEDVRPYEEGLEMRPLGEQRYVVDAMANAFQVLQQETKRIQGHLRALNARAGRIRKQLDREEEAIAHGEDPTNVPRSSKGLPENELFIPVPVRTAPPTSQRRPVRRPQVQQASRRQPQASCKIKLSGFDAKQNDNN
jgi:hypothetical protein